ncbi:hypothetical protein HYY72_02025 [Candidatus Woesearchaeota archaeon]|nr:hypothetical protein [Candidatus Woesearchaeota archaeon]
MEQAQITTGVDKLVALIEEKKRVSIIDASKELSVPSVVIEEWADFLQQQGLIDIQYKFTTPFLVRRELSKDEISRKSKDFEGRKEGFIRKIEAAIDYIEHESLGLKKVKEEFVQLSRELETEVKKVRNELSTLENYEKLKRGLDREILEQQQAFKSQMDSVESQLLEKQKAYEEISEHIREQELKLDEEMTNSGLIRKNEEILKQRIKKIQRAAQVMEQQLRDEDSNIGGMQSEIRQLKAYAERIRSGIDMRKNDIAPLIEQRRSHQKKIEEMQEAILKKVAGARQRISSSVTESSKAKEKFERFFDEKVDIDVMMDKINMDLEKLKHELSALITEAKLLELASPRNMERHISELEKKFRDANSKRERLEEEIFSLGRIINKSQK